MKSIRYILPVMAAALMTMTSCQQQYITYDDAEYIGFSDTLSFLAVQDPAAQMPAVDTLYMSVPVVSTVTRDYDRTVGVEILDKKSNAIEGLHFGLKSQTIVIPAGSNRADVQVWGSYDEIQSADSLCFTMKLLMKDNLVMQEGSDETRVQLRKVCTFRLEDFTGWTVFTSMFHREFNQPYQRLVYTEKVEGKENTIRCRNMFNDGYDVELSFDNTWLLNPIVTMPEEQIISDEATFFGQTKGDNHIRAVHSPLVPSNFFTNETMPYISLWSMLYVKNLGQEIGTVGHFYSIMEWIEYREAKRLATEESLPGFNQAWGKPGDNPEN